MTDSVSPDNIVSHSVKGQAWRLRFADLDRAFKAAEEHGISDLQARMLLGRGIDEADFQTFLSPTLRDTMPDPSTLQDMDKAAGLIIDAVEAGTSITVFADYDVDGGSSAAQLIRWGRYQGAEMGLYVPDRLLEGYGPSEDAFRKIKDSGAELVITVDCGAAAMTALSAAADMGLDVIVVDHHLMDEGELPPCLALVNPNRPDDTSGLGHLAAAGVTFLLLVALNRELRRRGRTTPESEFDLMSVLGLSSLGTICDVVSLTGLNRAIASQGLKALEMSPLAGTDALRAVSDLNGPIQPYHVGFVIGPRINAGGRVGQANAGAKLLSTDDPDEAARLADMLDKSNVARKQIEKDCLDEAMAAAQRLPGDHSVTIVSGEGWHAGVIGIVASRVKEKTGRPAIVIGIDDAGLGKGSGRSIKGVNLGAAISAAYSEGLLLSGGGHAMAGGLSIEHKKIADFTEFMENRLAGDVKKAMAEQALSVDAVLFPAAINLSLLDEIKVLEPFGAGNPEPVFALENVRCVYADRLRGGHVRCTFEDDSGLQVRGICFRAEESGLAEILMSSDKQKLNVAGKVKLNEWKGRRSVDFHVIDLAVFG